MPLGSASKRDKQALKAEAAAAAAARLLEEASWVDTDKKLVAKERRSQEREAKADAKLSQRLEHKNLEAIEEEQVTSRKENMAPVKITQAEIARRTALAAASQAKSKTVTKVVAVQPPKLEPNRNRETDVVDARSLDEAVAALNGLSENGGAPVTKASYMQAFNDFQERTMVQLRDDKPGLKMAQLKDHVVKLWARSPENPARGKV